MKEILFILLFISKVFTIRVENLRELSKDSTSITIEWNKVIKDAADSINNTNSSSINDWVGYKIKYSRDDDNAITLNYLNNLNENKYRIEKLLPYTSYKIQVSAYKAINNEEGPSSNLLDTRTTEAGKNIIIKKKMTKNY